MRIDLGMVAIMALAGYSIYAWAYKGQEPETTKEQLMKVYEKSAHVAAHAPQWYYQMLQTYFPGYKEWTNVWVEEQLDKNGNRPY